VGLNPALIARALSTFRSDAAMAPGRFNRLEVDGVELVLDYAHNAAAMQALGEAVNTLDARRTHVVMGPPRRPPATRTCCARSMRPRPSRTPTSSTT
jgi:cyanophycin synthetase